MELICTRCKKLKSEKEDESVIDTLKDMAVYSLLCICLLEDKKAGK